MVDFIYLDNNATTKCDSRVVEEMLPFLKENFGNASSLYAFGKDVKKKITKARKLVASLLNAEPSEIVFTSCASESNTAAILSAAFACKEKKHIITTKVEHASVLETMKFLEKQGFEVTYLSVDKNGNIDLEELKKSIKKETALICVMMANNEIGNVYPVHEIGQIAKANDVLFHCDAVQAIGKVEVDVKKLNASTLSFSGHKIHAPKGVGVLYVKKGVDFKPLVFGHQESERRGGTENVAGILALGKAVEILMEDGFESSKKIEDLRNSMEQKIREKIENVVFYGDIKNRLSNTSCMAFAGVDAHELMFMLETKGVLVSTGSACNSESAKPSHVLVACGADLKNYQPIRVSLSRFSTEAEIERFVDKLSECVLKLRR